MMQVSKQPKILTLLVLSIVSSFIFVGSANAANTSSNTLSRQGFCAELNTISSSLNGQLSQKINNLTSLQDARANDMKIRFANRDKELATGRTHWDTDRKEQYEKMETKVTNDIQKQSLEQYKTGIESAVLKRRANVDLAMSSYRSSIDSSLSVGRGSIMQFVNTYKEAVVATEAKAQANCAAGKDPTIVRETFRSDLQAARTTLVNSTNGFDKVGVAVGESANTRSNSISTALSEFRTFTNQARDALKTALKQ